MSSRRRIRSRQSRATEIFLPNNANKESWRSIAEILEITIDSGNHKKFTLILYNLLFQREITLIDCCLTVEHEGELCKYIFGPPNDNEYIYDISHLLRYLDDEVLYKVALRHMNYTPQRRDISFLMRDQPISLFKN